MSTDGKYFWLNFQVISFLVLNKICIISYACDVAEKHICLLSWLALLSLLQGGWKPVQLQSQIRNSMSNPSALYYFLIALKDALSLWNSRGKELITWKRVASKICSFSQLWPSSLEIKCPVDWCITLAPAHQHGSAPLGLQLTGQGGTCWVTFSNYKYSPNTFQNWAGVLD